MRTLLVAALATAGLAAAHVSSAAEIDVMTQNQYLGADIAPLVEPGLSGEEFLARVAAAFQQVAANRPGERIEALAAEIAGRKPHLVGLQEVFSFSCESLVPVDLCSQLPFAGAFNDHLALMEEALGSRYRVVGEVRNLEIALEIEVAPGASVVISVVDRDVILARSDVQAAALLPAIRDLACDVPLRSADGCNYQVTVPLESLGTSIKRGYVAATAMVSGRSYLFVNTHLETREPYAFFQALQAMELMGAVSGLSAGLDLPAIVVGDFNSSPNDTAPVYVPPIFPGVPEYVPSPYMTFTTAMTDAWMLRPGNVAGLSCCQLADLSNHRSQLYERIDLIWSSVPPLKVKQARVVGDTVNTRTAPPGRGKWPSDHASVAATLQFR